MKNNYSIWVLEYSCVPDYPVSGIVYGAHNEGTRKLSYCYVVIKGGEHTMMVDVGFDNQEYIWPNATV